MIRHLKKMDFTADKTKLIWFSLKKPDVEEQPILVFEDEDGSLIFEPVKDLSIRFGSTFSWTLIFKKEIHEAYGRLINLKRSLPKLISSQQKAFAYETYIQPLLINGSRIWFPNKTNIEKLKTLRALLPGGCLVRHLKK